MQYFGNFDNYLLSNLLERRICALNLASDSKPSASFLLIVKIVIYHSNGGIPFVGFR